MARGPGSGSLGTDDEREESVSDEIIIGGDSADIPPGTYPGALYKVDVKTSDQFGEFRTWDFQIRKADGEVVVIGGASSMNTGAKSKAGRWIAAMLGRPVKAGEKVDMADLFNKPVLVVVAEKDGWPSVADVLPKMATPEPVAAGKVEKIDDLPF